MRTKCYYYAKKVPLLCSKYFPGSLIFYLLMYQQIEASTSPPGQPPGHLNFWKIFVQIPPSSGRKAVQMPHPRENYQITVLAFQ